MTLSLRGPWAIGSIRSAIPAAGRQQQLEDKDATVETVTRIVVIGAGQAGLSVAHYLKRFDLQPGSDFIVVDRGLGPGGAWQFRWEQLRLGSAHKITDLPGMDALEVSFDTADRAVPARAVVADYYRRYEDHYDLQVRRPVFATQVANRGADLVVATTAGDISTQLVVNATGTWGAPFIPYYPGMRSFAGRHLHTAEYSSAADLAGQHVVIVGGGTSAVGFLMELEGIAASTQWATRRPADFRDELEPSPESSAAMVSMQDEAARSGRALPSIVSGTGIPRTRRIATAIERGTLVDRRMFTRIEERGVRWPDGSWSPADVIIWATGFRPVARQLAPLRLREKAGGNHGGRWGFRARSTNLLRRLRPARQHRRRRPGRTDDRAADRRRARLTDHAPAKVIPR